MISSFKKISTGLLISTLLVACGGPSEAQPQPQNTPLQEAQSAVTGDQVSNTPSLPSVPSQASGLIQDIAERTESDLTATPADLPDTLPPAQISQDLNKTLSPSSVEECEALQDPTQQDLCYEAGDFAKNAPSTSADLGQ